MIGREITLAELNDVIWDHTKCVDKRILSDIVNQFRPGSVELKALNIYPEGQVPGLLEILPFSSRTQRAVQKYSDYFKSPSLTFGQVMALREVGLRSALEFASVAEAAGHYPELTEVQSSFIERFELIVSKSYLEKDSDTPGDQPAAGPVQELSLPTYDWQPNDLAEKFLNALRENATSHYSRSDLEQFVSDMVRTTLLSIDSRNLQIMEERLLCIGKKSTLTEIGAQHGVTRERIRQIESQAIEKLKIFQNSMFALFVARANLVRNELGNALEYDKGSLEEKMEWALADFEDNPKIQRIAKYLLLHLGGPYELVDNWLVTDRDLLSQTTSTIRIRLDSRGSISQQQITKVLDQQRILREFHTAWIRRTTLFQIESGQFIFLEGNFIEKSKSILRYFDRPMSAEAIADFFEPNELKSLKSLKNRLHQDRDIWRVNIQGEFAIADSERYQEYSSIVDAITQEIDANSGSIHIHELTEILDRKYRILPNSVISFVHTPRFKKSEAGIVSIQPESEALVDTPTLLNTPNCYLDRNKVWCWRVEVDKNILRGSGRKLPKAFARELGCELGDNIMIPSNYGEIRVGWPFTAVTGAFIGSLRTVALELEAELGDYLFVCASKPEANIVLLPRKRLQSARSKLIELALMLGNVDCDSDEQAIETVAMGFELDSDSRDELLTQARRRAVARGDTKITELMKQIK